jgi:hypothetical protein
MNIPPATKPVKEASGLLGCDALFLMYSRRFDLSNFPHFYGQIIQGVYRRGKIGHITQVILFVFQAKTIQAWTG